MSYNIDLHSGYPFWLVKNGLLADYPALDRSLPAEEIVIIGSGVSGALAAHSLCAAGFRCTMLDKRLVSSGSTWASTAQLNYEIDSSLSELAKHYDEAFAAGVYRANLDAVHRIQEIAAEAGLHTCLEPKDSLYLASDKQGAKANEKEYALRQKHGLPVELLDRDGVAAYGIDRRNALFHQHAVQLDAYRLTAGLIQYNVERGNLTVYTRTAVTELQPEAGGVTLQTEKGHTVKARYAVCAPGYESARFLPKNVMDLHSTYALVTQPMPPETLWKDRCLIWESVRPYFYLRTTGDNRIMMGGEDVRFKNEKRRDALLEKKTETLLKKYRELLPQSPPVMADFSWCGTFGETDDGLPYIGLYPGIDCTYFALGYGGNGTTYSVIAAEIITNALMGKPDPRADLFSFTR